MKKLLFALGLLVSGFGFAQEITVRDTAQVDQPVQVPQIVVKVPFGKLTTFGDTGIKITNITDSRCPSNVTCIWAGNVVVDYTVYKNGKFVETKKLTLAGGDQPTFFKSDLNWLKAYSVVPYPKTSAGINQGDYVISMIWNRIQIQTVNN